MGDLATDVESDLSGRLGDLRSRKRLDAVVEASRVAVLGAVPRVVAAHDALLATRGPARPRPAHRWFAPFEIVVLVAVLLGIIAAGLVLPSPRNGRPALGVEAAAPWVGAFALVTVVIFAVIERGRRDSFYLGAHTRNAPRFYLFLAILWILVLVYMLTNWTEQVAPGNATIPVLGVILLSGSIVGVSALALVARRRDRAARTDPAVAAKDEWGRGAADVDPVEQWWTELPNKLSPAERGAADRSYGVAIDVLERERIIRPADARRLRRKKPPVVWRGDAG